RVALLEKSSMHTVVPNFYRRKKPMHAQSLEKQELQMGGGNKTKKKYLPAMHDKNFLKIELQNNCMILKKVLIITTCAYKNELYLGKIHSPSTPNSSSGFFIKYILFVFIIPKFWLIRALLENNGLVLCSFKKMEDGHLTKDNLNVTVIFATNSVKNLSKLTLLSWLITRTGMADLCIWFHIITVYVYRYRFSCDVRLQLSHTFFSLQKKEKHIFQRLIIIIMHTPFSSIHIYTLFFVTSSEQIKIRLNLGFIRPLPFVFPHYIYRKYAREQIKILSDLLVIFKRILDLSGLFPIYLKNNDTGHRRMYIRTTTTRFYICCLMIDTTLVGAFFMLADTVVKLQITICVIQIYNPLITDTRS
ncbi:hypothetical protein ACJX0J_015227, partial [Zea mays]